MTNRAEEPLGLMDRLKARLGVVRDRIGKNWRDAMVLVICASAAAFASFQGSRMINPVIFSNNDKACDVWFQSDMDRVFSNMTSRGGDHFRTNVHPLFSLAANPPVALVRKLFGMGAATAVRGVIAAVAAMWIATLFILMRLLGCRRVDAILFSGLGATSAAAMFWFVVPETYSFGSLTLLLVLCFVALAGRRRFSSVWAMMVSALSLSMTTTNWMAGVAMTFVHFSKWKAVQITVNAFCLVTLLWAVQKTLFPSAGFFFPDRAQEQTFMFMASSGGPLHVLKSALLDSMVMPAINVDVINIPPHWSLLSTQFSVPGSGSPWGTIAVGSWTALLALGVWGLVSNRQHRKLAVVLGLVLLGQLLLHTVYGNETFLYALHFIPLLITLAAFSAFTRARIPALCLAFLLMIAAGVNNAIQLNRAMDFLDSQAPQRYQVLLQMQRRPQDPWPRGAGHVVLAAPGSPGVDKAYHEPGGGFSPSVGSFGVALWLVDKSGKLQATSDSLPIAGIEQQLLWSDGQAIPGILTQTRYYQAEWRGDGPGNWTLDLAPQPGTGLTAQLVVRSVGPAGGPIHALHWDGERLLINGRWSLTCSNMPSILSLGEEGHKGWMREIPNSSHWEGTNGWGYARFQFAGDDALKVSIHDSHATALPPSPPFSDTRTAIDLDLPAGEFATCLKAQVAHLMMGLCGQETRPGDPTSYPFAWQRDGSYAIVALARVGKLREAMALSRSFAAKDFFGGFGAEADAPGLSIWALEEVASRLKQAEYDKSIWPHVRRKAEFIMEMLTTTRRISKEFTGPVLPSLEKQADVNVVAEPARNGLIVGRTDRQHPLLFVNAASYRGLMDASSVAERMNHPEDSKRWRDAAARLQRAWAETLDNANEPDNTPSFFSALRPIWVATRDKDAAARMQRSWEEAVLHTNEADNPRTYVSALWPTWVGVQEKQAISQHLERRWQRSRDASGNFRSTPQTSYFDVAEAHQWLFTDHPERLWPTLRWFWHNQASPGLYTWWENDREDPTSSCWNDVRGWTKPPHVTPQYRTAAEMVLLQLDMLAYTDLAADRPTVVIGAGLPPEWLKQPMNVRGLHMPNGRLDWHWDRSQMRVTICGDPVQVSLGSVFPTGTAIHMEYIQPKGDLPAMIESASER